MRERLNLHPKLLRNFPSIKKKRVKLSKKEKKIRCRSSEEEEEKKKKASRFRRRKIEEY